MITVYLHGGDPAKSQRSVKCLSSLRSVFFGPFLTLRFHTSLLSVRNAPRTQTYSNYEDTEVQKRGHLENASWFFKVANPRHNTI